ncbi:unnamed protein product [Aspergillus oryzae]|nr:unnamed protein product [Aspergillus oryzae]GMF94787.1 unnamed protein product [Aspergillus oryzae]
MLREYFLLPLLAACGAAVEISVASSGGNATSGLQYGIMEELIRNRAFQGGEKYPSNLDAWIPVDGSALSLKNLSQPLSSALPTSVNVKGTAGKAGLTNLGWWGIDVREQTYTGSFYVKGAYNGTFTASLQSNKTGEVYASAVIVSKSARGEWTQHNFTLTPTKAASNTQNTFSITFDASVILAVWGGFALNGDAIPESELGTYVQDALDELEFLTGSVDTEYGALRASLGHPEPWTVKYVEVGNEDNLNDGLDSYKSYRFQAFYDAIKEQYPDITVLASTVEIDFPGDAGGDYHLYDTPDNFVEKFNFFDHSTDAKSSGATPAISHSTHGGSAASQKESSSSAPKETPTKSLEQHTFGPLYYVAGVDNTSNSHIFKAAVYNSTADVPVSLTFDGVKAGTSASLTVLTAADPLGMNEVGAANIVDKKTSTVTAGVNGVFDFSLPNLSVAVLKTE